MRESIRFAWTTATRFLSFDGLPIFPVRNSEELSALETLVASMGGQLCEHAEPFEFQLASSETVVAFGAAVAEEAALYAHLTQRRVELVEGISGLERVAAPEVIVALDEQLDYDLLSFLYRNVQSPLATGIVAAPDLSSLRLQVLVRSAAALLCCDVDLRRVDLLPMLAFAKTASSECVMLGQAASSQETAAMISTGAGVLSIQTHSDGIDAFLHPELILCPMVPTHLALPEHDLPRCRLNGTCHRLHIPLEEALGSGMLFPPELLQARILVLDVCWGLRPPSDVNSAGWGYMHKLLHTYRVGAILVTWEFVRTHPRLMTSLADDIAAGEPVGIALARHNRKVEPATGNWMCLIGDPRVKLPAAPSMFLAGRFIALEDTLERKEIAEQLAYLRAYITNVKHSRHGTYEDHYEAAIAALENCEREIHCLVPLRNGGEGSLQRFRRTLLDFLCGRWPVTAMTWMELAESAESLGSSVCSVCRRTAEIMLWKLWTPGAPRRITTKCPNCGFSADVPENRSLRLEVNRGGTASIQGDISKAEAALTIEGAHGRTVLSWPMKGNELLSNLHLGMPWPEGPLRIGVFVVWENLELGVLGAALRGEKLDPRPLPDDFDASPREVFNHTRHEGAQRDSEADAAAP